MAEELHKIKLPSAVVGDENHLIYINTGEGAQEFKIERGTIQVPYALIAPVLGSFPGSVVVGGNTADDAK